MRLGPFQTQERYDKEARPGRYRKVVRKGTSDRPRNATRQEERRINGLGPLRTSRAQRHFPFDPRGSTVSGRQM